MFEYKKFKEEMNKKGYKIRKNGNYIIIAVNKGGFANFTDVFDPDLYYTNNAQLKIIRCEHYNDYIYQIRLKIEG